MADELIGGIGVTVTADYAPLLAHLDAAEEAARAGGQSIGGALGQGLQSGSAAAAKFGAQLQASIVAPSAAATAATQQLAGALAQESEAAVSSVASNEAAAAGFEAMATSASHGVTQIQALSGGIRVLEGSQGIRAVERFLASIPGVGAAFQAAFPIIGAVALAEIIGKIFNEIDPLTQAEKRLAEQTKQTDAEFARMGKEITELDAKFMTARFGKAAGLQIIKSSDLTDMEEARAKMLSLDMQVHNLEQSAGGARASVIGLAAALGPLGALIGSMTFARGAAADTKELQEALDQQENIHRQMVMAQHKDAADTEQEKKDAAAEAKRANQEANTALKQSYQDQLADLKSQHQLTIADELKFWEDRLAAVTKMGKAYAAVHREVAREVGNIEQRMAKEAAEAFDKGLLAHQAGMKKLAENNERMVTEADDEIDRMREAAQRLQEGLSKAGAQSGMQTQDQSFAIQKLALARQYGDEESHTAQEQIRYAEQFETLNESIANAKISRDQADASALKDSGQQVQYAEALNKLQADINEELQREYSAETAITVLKEKNNYLDQLEQSLLHGATEAMGSLTQGLSRAIVEGGKFGKQFHEDIKRIEEEILNGLIGNTLARLGHALQNALKPLASQGGILGAIGHIAGGGQKAGSDAAETANTTALHMLSAQLHILQAAIGQNTGAFGLNTGALTQVMAANDANLATTTANTTATAANAISTDANTISVDSNTLATVWNSIVEAAKAIFGYADGGAPPVGIASMVGERGPELFIPNVPGTIIPNHALQARGLSQLASAGNSSGQRGMQVNNFHIQNPQPRQTLREIATYVKSQTPQYAPYSR